MNYTFFNLHDLAMLNPEIAVLAGAFIFLIVGAFLGTREIASTTVGGVLVAALALAFLLYVPGHDGSSVKIFNQLLIIDSFSQYTKMLLLLTYAFVLVLSHEWVRSKMQSMFEFAVLLSLSLVGMMVMVSANNFMTLYLGLELSSLALYVLAAFDRENALSSEAGIKYFVLGSLASGMMLFGVSLIYGFTGSTDFEAISKLFVGCEDCATIGVPFGAIVGMVLLTVGFCFKISAVPFHMWTPDVYTGAPTAVTMFFASAPKLAALVVFIRVLNGPLHAMFPDWQNILAFIANASMIIGALGAIMQTNFKRLLAYGSIGHIGYALVGVAAGTPDGVKAVLIYMTLYLFMAIGTFGFILFMRRKGQYVESLSNLSGLSQTCPAGAFFLLLMMFSMAGIPPLAGFWGKMFVFQSAIEAGLYSMTIIGLLTSVVAAYYYLRVVKVMYFDAPEGELDADVPLSARFALGICAFITGTFFLYPDPILQAAEIAARAIG